jgi:hypothetical protein
MPQPVQPPETPAIIQSVTAEDAAPLDKSSSGNLESLRTPTLPTGVVAIPTPPETFTPESSSLLTAAKSAALLGPPISVGYSLQRRPVATEELQVSKLKVVSDSVAGRDSAQARRSPSSNLQPSNLQPSNLQPSNLTLEDSLPLRYQPSTEKC